MVINRLDSLAEQFVSDIYAYVIMRAHYHLMVKIFLCNQTLSIITRLSNAALNTSLPVKLKPI